MIISWLHKTELLVIVLMIKNFFKKIIDKIFGKRCLCKGDTLHVAHMCSECGKIH